MENNSKLFVRCSNCGRANDPDCTSCKQCNSALPLRSVQDTDRNKRLTNKLSFLLHILLVIPGYFVYDRISSYGQNSIVVVDDMLDPPEPQTVKLPKEAWFNRSLKSWVYDVPSVRDVVVKDIELSGGWEAMRRRTALEISADLYAMSCDELDSKEIKGELEARPPDKVILKVKAPDKYYRRVDSPSFDDPLGSPTRTQVNNGKETFECALLDSRWSCEKDEAVDSTMPSGLIAAMTNYSDEFELYNRVRVENFRNRTVYTIRGHAKHPYQGESGGYRTLMFDTVIGRLVAVQFATDVYIGFEDFRKVGSVSLPHRFCVNSPYLSQAMVITSWNLTPEIDDSVFERPN